MLRLTPPEVFQLSYGINTNKMANTLSPIKEAVEIGPPTPSRQNEDISIRINGKDQRFK